LLPPHLQAANKHIEALPAHTQRALHGAHSSGGWSGK
jgi:hypothetical protein